MIRALQECPLMGTALSRHPGELADPLEQELARDRALTALSEVEWTYVLAATEALMAACSKMSPEDSIGGFSRYQLREFLLRIAERGSVHTERYIPTLRDMFRGN